MQTQVSDNVWLSTEMRVYWEIGFNYEEQQQPHKWLHLPNQIIIERLVWSSFHWHFIKLKSLSEQFCLLCPQTLTPVISCSRSYSWTPSSTVTVWRCQRSPTGTGNWLILHIPKSQSHLYLVHLHITDAERGRRQLCSWRGRRLLSSPVYNQTNPDVTWYNLAAQTASSRFSNWSWWTRRVDFISHNSTLFLKCKGTRLAT